MDLIISVVAALILVYLFVRTNFRPKKKHRKSYTHKPPKHKAYSHKKLNPYKPAKTYTKKKSKSPHLQKNRLYLPKEEYAMLSLSERSQLELDVFKAKLKKADSIAIGQIYERQIGRLYEEQGYDVTFHGIKRGYFDQGIDLIAKKEGVTRLIQTKCWAQGKIIDEDLILKFHQDAHSFSQKKPKLGDILPIFYTNIEYSSEARKLAQELNVRLKHMSLDLNPPLIKCNINAKGEKIFHLPTDKFYYKVKINPSDGDAYVHTIAEAESLGFRRARSFKKPKAS